MVRHKASYKLKTNYLVVRGDAHPYNVNGEGSSSP